MNIQLDALRQQASRLSYLHRTGDKLACSRVHRQFPDAGVIQLSDALNVIARENGFSSWAVLRSSRKYGEMNIAGKRERLKIALFYGQHWVVDRLLRSDPAISTGDLGLEIALYDKRAVQKALKKRPKAAIQRIGVRTPILHLAFSRHIHCAPENESDMLAIADLLRDNGASVNDGFPSEPGSQHMLSALYGAVGHANNAPLAKWLLENGANPNDGESLYHSTEHGQLEGTKLLLEHGAVVEGTNALLRAMDFNDHELVLLLLKNCENPNRIETVHPSGQATLSVPVMHQAARRLCDRRMAQILLDAGADPTAEYCGHSSYAYARIYGNREVAEEILQRGMSDRLDETESLLASIADDTAHPAARVQYRDLPDDIQMILTNLLQYSGRLSHCQRLVESGFDFEKPDEMDVTPVQIAGWEGLPDTMNWLLSLGPDLEHINGFGGNLLSTIIHGSENCPERSRRDHLKCAELALRAGVPLSLPAIDLAGEEKMAEFLIMWAEEHLEQVTS